MSHFHLSTSQQYLGSVACNEVVSTYLGTIMKIVEFTYTYILLQAILPID